MSGGVGDVSGSYQLGDSNGVKDAGNENWNGQLRTVLDEMEQAFNHLHYSFLCVKEATKDLKLMTQEHTSHMPMASNGNLENEIKPDKLDLGSTVSVAPTQKVENDHPPIGRANCDAHSLSGSTRQRHESPVEWRKQTSPSSEVAEVEEPAAYRMHQIHRQCPDVRAKSEAPSFIRASGFGRNANTNELRMSPDWMELQSKSNRALEVAASGLGGSGVQSAQSLINRSVAFTKDSRRGIDTCAEEAQRMWQSSASGKCGKCGKCSRFMTPISPHSAPRMAWDMAGCFMLILDAFTLPITLAWDIELTSSVVGYVFLWASLSFWTLDVLTNFNTGFYLGGVLHLRRKRIVKNYMSGWFVFDLFIVSLDYFLVLTSSDDSQAMRIFSALRSMRSLRALRAVRLLRLMKMRKFNAIIEEAALATGRPWLLIMLSMLKILITMLVAAHVLSCLWYFIGRFVSEKGRLSWLDYTEATRATAIMQYLHALQWLLTPPSLAPLDPGSSEERLGNIFIVVFTLIVMGSALGKFTSALQELNAMNSERTRKRREVRSYLQSNANSKELIMRIMRFVDHKLSVQDASAAVDLSLISSTLQMELYVNQRSIFLERHALFLLTKEIYPTTYAHICGAAVKHGFEKNEEIFQAGQFANMMIITALGEYKMLLADGYNLVQDKTKPCGAGAMNRQLSKDSQESDDNYTKFSGVHWFAESCIFAEGTIHSATLFADTPFCESFSLTSRNLQVALQDSPACTYMFCEYAKDFLLALKQCKDASDFEEAEEACLKAVKQNQHYMELHPDPMAIIDNFGNTKIKHAMDSMGSRTRRPSFLRKNPAMGTNASNAQSIVSANPSVSDDLGAEFPEGEENEKKTLEAKRFMQNVLGGDITHQADLSTGLQTCITELDPETGCHGTFSGTGERDRSESSCLSILNLVADQYDNFTSPQNPNARLTEKQWAELQEILGWIQPTEIQVFGVVILLAIRSLGKSKRLVQQLPAKYQRPEAAVIYLIQQQRNVVPSVNLLDYDTQHLLVETLQVHESFNFAQMLQGENCPANILQLKEMIKDNIDLFKFYMLFFLGFMCGLAGGQGSRIMNSKMAEGIIMGCRSLMCLLSATPQAVYWSYMVERARVIDVPTGTPEDLALIRLACLSRVQDHSSYLKLRAAWMSTSVRSRKVLLNHFLADGIIERAFVLEFLPLCISNAEVNKQVRLPALLEVIVELLDNLIPACAGSDPMMIPVGLNDMAEFIAVVKNRFIFQTCIMRSDIRRVGSDNRISLEMSSANWTRTQDPDSDFTTIAHDVKQILCRMDLVEAEGDEQNDGDMKDYYLQV